MTWHARLQLDYTLEAERSVLRHQHSGPLRILLHRSIADDFIRRFVERARKIRVGDPLDATTEVGPLSNAAHYQRVMSYVDIAKSEGGELLSGGRRPPALNKGYYLELNSSLCTRRRR